MAKHDIYRLVPLVNTAYYQDENHKAVCEVTGRDSDGTFQVALFVDGEAAGASPSLKDALSERGIAENGWTTKPGQQ